jgi:hypothetical protein
MLGRLADPTGCSFYSIKTDLLPEKNDKVPKKSDFLE